MTTGKALNGKPYAGNPHVRFDEGEVASAAMPRRGSLLYKCCNPVRFGIAVTVAVLMTSFASAVTTRTWTGGAGDGKYTTAANWNPSGSPVDNDYSDAVVFNDGACTVNIDAVRKISQTTIKTPGWTFAGNILKAKNHIVASDCGVITVVGFGLSSGSSYTVGSGSTLEISGTSIIESTKTPQLTGGGTLYCKSKLAYNYYSAGGAFVVKDDSLLMTDQTLASFANTHNSYAWTIQLASKGARFRCQGTVDGVSARFETSVKKAWNLACAYDTDNYELAAKQVDETYVEVYLKQKGAEEGDPFVLGIPSASGSATDGITMSCPITDFNTTESVELRLSFGTDKDVLSQIKSWDVTGDGTFSCVQTEGVDYGTRYYYQFVCEGTTNGVPCIKESIVCSFVTPHVATWIAPYEDDAGVPATNDWTIAANWESSLAPRALSDAFFTNNAAVASAGSHDAKSLTVTNAASVRLTKGDYAFSGSVAVGIGSANNALTVASGATVTSPGIYLDEANKTLSKYYGHQSLSVTDGAMVTAGELRTTDCDSKVTVDGGTLVVTNFYNAQRMWNSKVDVASTVSVKNGGTFKVPGTFYLNQHVDGARLYVTDGANCEVGTLDMGYGADSGYAGEIILSNATMKVDALNFQGSDQYKRCKVYLYEDEGEMTSLTCRNVLIGNLGNACRAGFENELNVYGGSVAVTEKITLGGLVNSTNNVLRIGNGKVSTKNLLVQNKSIVRFDVPENGYASPAVSASGAVTVNDSEIQIDASNCSSGAWQTLIASDAGIAGLTNDNLSDMVTVIGTYGNRPAKIRLVTDGETVTALQLRLASPGLKLMIR